MNDKQPFKLEPEEPLQDEDDSDCFEKIGIPKKLGGEPGTLTGVCLCELLCVLLAQVTS